MALLGIDIGTSFIKSAVLDVDRRTLGYVKRVPFPDPLQGLHPSFCEYDPGRVLDSARQMLSVISESGRDVEGLVISTQLASMILVDDLGRPRSNCIGWRDQRALMQHPSGDGSYFDVYRKNISSHQRRSLGNEMPVGMPGSFLFWIAGQGGAESGLMPLSLGDFLARSLCGVTAGVEASTAMAYCLFNIETMDWHREVIANLGLDAFAWPPLVPQASIVGHLELNGRNIPCYTPVGDYQCSLVGALIDGEDLSINISTGSQVSRITADLELGDYQSRPFFDGQFTNTLSHLPAGRSLNVLVELLTELGRRSGHIVEDPWKWIDEAIQSATKSNLSVDLAFYPGPCGEQGSISNIQEKNLTIGSLFLGAFANMAANYKTVSSRIWPENGWKKVVLSGGLANKLPALHRAIQQEFKEEVELCRSSEEALRGLLILAMAFSGNSTSVTAAMNEVRHTPGHLKPDPAKKESK